MSETDRVEIEREPTADDPIQRFWPRYASGELTHGEFEQRLEGLVETEDAEVAGSTERAFERE